MLSLAMAIATVQRSLDRDLIQEEEYKGLIAYLNKRKNTYKLSDKHIQDAEDKLDAWEDMVDYRGMTTEEMHEQEKEDNDNLYRAAKKLLDQFKRL